MADDEPASVPADDPVSFAEEPKPECYWPLRSSDARRRDAGLIRCPGFRDGAVRCTDETLVLHRSHGDCPRRGDRDEKTMSKY